MARPNNALPGDASRPMLRSELRRRTRLAVWGDRSAQVRFYRRALPVVIALLALLLIGWIGVRAVLTFLAQRNATVGSIRMTHPKFYGRDNEGRAFVVNAQSATRDGRDINQITMEQPVFVLHTKDGQPTITHSLTGLYREDSRMLILSGQVVLDDGHGYVFNSERALVDTQSGRTSGETAVTGVGPLGQIAASSYAISDNGAHMFFKGNVRTHLNNSNERQR